jgi:hypothetical protein
MKGRRVKLNFVRQAIANFIARHWHGELPAWIGLLIIPAAMVAVFRGFDYCLALSEEALFTHADDAWVTLANVTVYYVCQLICTVWWLGGQWRSAIKHFRNRSGHWETIAAITIAFTLLVAGVWLEVFAPECRDAVDAVNGDPQWGETSIEAAPDGKIIYFAGPITETAAHEFEQNTALINGSAKMVVLESEGGRLGAARKIQRSIRAHGLDALVTKKCSSACAIVFLGGKNRLIQPGAKIGFHSAYSVAGAENYFGLDADASLGISRAFLVKAYSVPPTEMWYPTNQELIAAGVVTKIIPEPSSE